MGDILGEDYERPEDIKESIEEIEKEIAGMEEENDDGNFAEMKEESIELLKEIEEEEELEEKEAIEEKLEDLHNNAPNAFVNGESKQNSDNESELPWVKLGHWVNAEGNGDAAKYEVWLALPLVLLLLVAAYRCKPRRGGGQRRSPRNGDDGYADIQLVGDSNMV